MPETIQDQLAQELIDEIESETQWDVTFAGSQDALHQLGEKALADLKVGQGQYAGFDDL